MGNGVSQDRSEPAVAPVRPKKHKKHAPKDASKKQAIARIAGEDGSDSSNVTLDGLQKFVHKRSILISDVELEGLFEELDTDKDGLISREEGEEKLKAFPMVGSSNLFHSAMECFNKEIVQILNARLEQQGGSHPVRAMASVDAVQLDAAWKRAQAAVAELVDQKKLTPKATTVAEFNAKFANDPTFEGMYKNFEDYKEGIKEVTGLPEKDINKGMHAEFCSSLDSTDKFTTSNYGGTTTTPLAEFEFVKKPDMKKAYPGGRVPSPPEIFFFATTAKKAGTDDECYDTPLEDLSPDMRDGVKTVLLRRVKEAGLERAFLTAAARNDSALKRLAGLGSGELEAMRKALDKALRGVEKRRREGKARAAEEHNAKTGQPRYEVVCELARKGGCGATQKELEALVRLMRWKLAEAQLWEEEVVGLRLYTGPAYMKVNGVLREWDVGRKGNSYVCTIFAAVSGMVKLAKISPIPEGRRVFRGQQGMRLPSQFWQEDEEGAKGGTELAFLSTTTEEEVALSYAAGGALPTVFEIQVGAVDKGAALGFLSQYPDEAEILMPPRSFLEVVGEPFVREAKTSGGPTAVLATPVKINCNLRCPTLEEIRDERKDMLLSTLQHVAKEVDRDLRAALETKEAKARARKDVFWDDKRAGMGKAAFVDSIKAEPREALAAATGRSATWYNVDKRFRREMQCALEVQRKAMGKFELWLHDYKTDTDPGFVSRSGRDCDRVASGRLRRELATKESEKGAEKKIKAVAMELCEQLEIVDGELDEVVDEQSGEVALLVQAGEGHEEKVELLLKAGADANATRADGKTTLMIAAEGGHNNIVTMLVTEGEAEVDARDYDNCTALMLAASNGQFVTVRALVGECGADVGCTNDNGWSALTYAVFFGWLETAKVLVDEGGADAIAKVGEWTNVMYAAQNGHLEVIKWLVKDVGVDGAATMSNGWTACNLAAETGNLECLKWLVKHGGADPTASMDDGRTGLMSAALMGRLEVVKWLVKHAGMDPNQAKADGARAVIWAAENGHLDVIKWLVDEAGADPKVKMNNGQSAVMSAALNGHLKTIKWLVKTAGVDPKAKRDDACSPLIWAAEKGHLDVVTWLVKEGGADATAAMNGGWTPLMAAAQCGQMEVVKWLVTAAGVDPAAVDDDGSTAIDVATRNFQTEVAEWLQNQ